MIIIEGPRNTGKTFLCSKLNQVPYKFPYAEIYREFDKNEDFNLGLSIGKDISYLTLPFCNSPYRDRGYLSTLVYGTIFKRFTKKEVQLYIKLIQKYKKNSNLIDINVIILGKNKKTDKERNKDNLIFYDINYDIQKKLYIEFSKFFNCVIFENNFDDKSILKFKKLIGNLNEYT